MDDVYSLRIFLEVARRQSFTGAADHFGISTSAVSKHVAALEKSLNARLLNRTTKQMHLTRAGAFLAEKGQEVVGNLDDLQETVVGLTGDVSGVIRVGAAPYFGAHRLVPAISAFCQQHPDIRLTITTLSKSRIEDFVGAGLDVGVVNTSQLPDMTHSAYTITDMPQVVVASPAYLKRRKLPMVPEDLAHHECLVNSFKSPTGTWRFVGADGNSSSVRVRGRVRASYGEAVKIAAVHGMGVSMHPRYMVADELKSGALVALLPGYEPELLRVYALYSAKTRLPLRVRTFIEFLRHWPWAL